MISRLEYSGVQNHLKTKQPDEMFLSPLPSLLYGVLMEIL
jgi:hypothetical protein